MACCLIRECYVSNKKRRDAKFCVSVIWEYFVLVGVRLAHAMEIVVEGVATEDFDASVEATKRNGWMCDAVEHVGFDVGVVVHVFKHYAFAYLQFVVELP